MNLFYCAIAFLLGAAMAIMACVGTFLFYIGAGEPDVNGDPEKDAGKPWPPSTKP